MIKTTNYSKLAIYVAVTSFMIGTILFVSYKTTHNYNLESIGILYILTAFIINSVILLVVIIEALINKTERRNLLLSSTFMLINIPITILYLINL